MKKTLIFILLMVMWCGRSWGTDWCNHANNQGCWLMEVDENPITDSSQNSNTASWVSDPAFATSSPPKTYSSGYYELDGNDYFYDDAYATLSPTDKVTATVWIKPDGSSYTNLEGYIGNIRWITLVGGYALIWRDNSIQFIINNYSGARATFSYTTTDVWVHLAGTYDKDAGSNQINVYVDGVAGTPATQTASMTYSGLNNFALGNGYGGNELDGDIDEGAVFDVALDSTDINEIMDLGLQPASTGATHKYSLTNINISGNITFQ